MKVEELTAFRPVLQQLEEDSAKYFGIAHAECRIERFVSRPYSEIVQLRVSGSGTSVGAYVKIFRTGDASIARTAKHVVWAFDTMTRLHGDMAGTPGLSVAKPIACFPEHLAIVTEEARGQTLQELLETKAMWWPSTAVRQELQVGLSRVGEWLRSFQRVSAPLDGALSIAEMREYLDVRLRILVQTPEAVFPEAERQRVLEAFDRRSAGVAEESLAALPVHADFAPGNVLVDGSNVVVLDFAMPARGVAYHDVAHLYMQLDLFAAKPQFRPDVIRSLQRSLLAGFDRALDPSEPLFDLLHLQHVACHLLGLVRQDSGRAASVYKWYLQRRHRRWLKAFCETA